MAQGVMQWPAMRERMRKIGKRSGWACVLGTLDLAVSIIIMPTATVFIGTLKVNRLG